MTIEWDFPKPKIKQPIISDKFTRIPHDSYLAFFVPKKQEGKKGPGFEITDINYHGENQNHEKLNSKKL